METRIAEVGKFHTFLNAAFGAHIVGDTLIDQAAHFRGLDAWTKLHYDGEVVFQLWSEPLESQVYTPDRRPVHQLRDVGNDLTGEGWVSWRERWRKKHGDKSYKLVDANLAFFWGPRTQLGQIFRAEWSTAGSGSNQAAHPHWHCDAEVRSADLTISDIHFGMAGWAFGELCPQSWQTYPSVSSALQPLRHHPF